jgi:hypothetical protein
LNIFESVEKDSSTIQNLKSACFSAKNLTENRIRVFVVLLLMLRMADQTGLVPWFGDHGPRLGFGGGGGLICKLPKF